MERAPSVASLLAWRAWAAVRGSWGAIGAGAAAGFALQAALPMANAWLAAAAAGGCLAVATGCLLAGAWWQRSHGRPLLDVRGLTRTAVVERSNTLEQFGHAFATAGLSLAALYAGAWLAEQMGL